MESMQQRYSVTKQAYKQDIMLDTIPGDKSISHRAAIFGSLAENQSYFKNVLLSEDCLNTIEIMQEMGVEIKINQTDLHIKGVGKYGLKAPRNILDVGNAGTGIRLLLGLLAGQSFSSTITGDASIQNRPMKRVIDPLTKMGALFQPTQKKAQWTAPITIKGNSSLTAINYTLPVASAQLKSALLIAHLYAKGELMINQPEASRDHTEHMLAYYGIPLTHAKLTIQGNLDKPLINPNPEKPITIPSDPSSAAFFIVYALCAKNTTMTLHNIGLNPSRIEFINHLKKMGGNIQITDIKTDGLEPVGTITAQSSQLTNTTIENIPFLIDEIPILAVAGLFAKGNFSVTDAAELRVKESDRIAGIITLCDQINTSTTQTNDGFTITPPTTIPSFDFDSTGDHRLAMSAMMLASIANINATITNCDCINTSFPTFFECLNQLIEK